MRKFEIVRDEHRKHPEVEIVFLVALQRSRLVMISRYLLKWFYNPTKNN